MSIFLFVFGFCVSYVKPVLPDTSGTREMCRIVQHVRRFRFYFGCRELLDKTKRQTSNKHIILIILQSESCKCLVHMELMYMF
jgi:hypothetical protein